MTEDNRGSENLPEFDDPSYAEIRALLADAAAPAAVPADVAARLDATLADLVAGRGEDDVVVPLRRRRPIGRRLLVAAAAVVLLGAGGVGMSQVLDNAQQGDSMATATADRDASAEAPAVPETATGGTGSLSGLGAKNQRTPLARHLAAAEFTAADFADQITDLVEVAAGRMAVADGTNGMDPGTAPTSGEQYSGVETPEAVAGEGAWRDTVQNEFRSLDTAAKAGGSCPGPGAPEGAVSLRITFDNHPAALVLHPVVGGSRYVAAWSCDGHELLAYTTVAS